MDYENGENIGFRDCLVKKLFNPGCWRGFITLSLSILCFVTVSTTYFVLSGSTEQFPDDSFVTKSLAAASRGNQYFINSGV